MQLGNNFGSEPTMCRWTHHGHWRLLRSVFEAFNKIDILSTCHRYATPIHLYSRVSITMPITLPNSHLSSLNNNQSVQLIFLTVLLYITLVIEKHQNWIPYLYLMLVSNLGVVYWLFRQGPMVQASAKHFDYFILAKTLRVTDIALQTFSNIVDRRRL